MSFSNRISNVLKGNLSSVSEASMSRVWKHFSGKDTSIVILTAFRGDLDYAKNEKRNKSLARAIRKAGFGFIYVDGFWIENQGQDDEEKVKEDSIFATSSKKQSKQLIKLAHDLANQYNQDAIFVKDCESGETYLLYKDGSKEKLSGTMSIGKISNFYTKLRNNKASNTFVFESARPNKTYNWNLSSKLKQSQSKAV